MMFMNSLVELFGTDYAKSPRESVVSRIPVSQPTRNDFMDDRCHIKMGTPQPVLSQICDYRHMSDCNVHY